MDIPLSKLNYQFSQKPLLVGGMAMEYYGIRKSGKDIDLIVPEQDVIALIRQYPDRVKNLYGDLGVCPFEFEIWRTICYFDYDYYKKDAIELDDILVISMENLLLMKALASKKEKYMKDLQMIAQNIMDKQGKKFGQIQSQNELLLRGIEGIVYIEKAGP